MKKTTLCALFLATTSIAAKAQNIYQDDLLHLQMHYETPSIHFTTMASDGQKYAAIHLDGYTLGGEVGSPALPVLSHYITTPFCSKVEVNVENAIYDTLQLTDANFQFYPQQPPRSKRDSVYSITFNSERYQMDAVYSMPIVSITPLGVERDRNLAQLTFAPVSVNPVSGQVIICRAADITVSFIDSDIQRTLDYFATYNTPAFASTSTLNAPFAKMTPGQAPVRVTIVAGNIAGIQNNSRLQDFVDWKRTQGYLVDVIYTSDLPSNTPSVIAGAIKQLYSSATEVNPAPTYVILIGDHAQLPAFNCNIASNNFLRGWGYQLDDHITDHYYATWTDDNLRDCYLGRFSATDTNQFNDIINKTLLYERYQFADDSYLGRTALVAGADNTYYTDSTDYGFTHADPTMDYIARYYINTNNGYTNVNYYKNNATFAPAGVIVTGSSQASSTATTLRNLYNEGIGWLNYSAHGEVNGWAKPSFNTNHVSRMTNVGKPMFVIGNCCLTNHFDSPSCFGEALLRKDNNAGAIGYIGGTNSTFWDEDFYFSVGVRSNIHSTMNTSYSSNHLGTYDRLFHTHGESFTSHAITAGSMVHAGLMAVNSYNTSSYSRDMIEYYWEIYELMGDPTLMPWLGVASELTATASLSAAGNRLTVHTDPYAYVALVDRDLSLVGAAFAGSDGSASIDVPIGRDLSDAFISITAQNRKPFTMPFANTPVGISAVNVPVTLAPNPATNRSVVQAEGLQRVQLLDMMGRILFDYPCNGSCILQLDTIPAGFYLVRCHTTDGVAINKLIVTK